MTDLKTETWWTSGSLSGLVREMAPKCHFLVEIDWCFVGESLVEEHQTVESPQLPNIHPSTYLVGVNIFRLATDLAVLFWTTCSALIRYSSNPDQRGIGILALT